MSPTLKYHSTPISVPLTVNGQQLLPGQSTQLAEDTYTLSVPPKVVVNGGGGLGFGVRHGYFDAAQRAAPYPNVWTLLQKLGASNVSGTGSLPMSWVNEAHDHGIKCLPTYTPGFLSPNKPGPFTSYAAIEAYLDNYNLSQWRNHPAIAGHELTGEPLSMDYPYWDPRNPSQTELNFIDIIKHGVEYVKQQDPTHPCWIGLCPPWTSYDFEPVWTEKQKAFISLFIDWNDVMDYHIYEFGDRAGDEFWRNPEVRARARIIHDLDDIMIPSAKGKPVHMGETGCPSSPFKCFDGSIAEFNEQNQDDYLRIVGEETTKRGVFVYIYRLIDPTSWSLDDYGLFNTEHDTNMNIPKLTVNHVKEYFGV